MAAESPLTELENLLGPRLFGVNLGGPPVMFAGRFNLLELRGHGARGLVVKARDTNLDRLVALKLFPFPEASLIAEAKGEAKALARLSHPNIVAVLDLSYAPLSLGDRQIPCLYLAMEFIEGPHVSAWIASTNPSTEDIIDAYLAAGEGLVAAHEAGVIHRDVKPANIVIDQRTARVVDFGLARVIPPGADPSAPRHTQYGATKGTLEYMSPEARRGRADARSDIFSYAVSLWESLTGALPFDPNAGEWRLAHQPDFEGADLLPPALAQVLRRALSYRPEDRHGAMRELLDAIETATRPKRAWQRPVLVAGGALLIVASALAFTRGDADTIPPGSIATSAPEPSRTQTPTQAPAPTSSEPSPPPPAASRPDAAAPSASSVPPPTCDAAPLAGQWRLNTRVLWADDSY
ncbi:MAG TPA: serine/threonine-protein kinase [Nannocystaceae bacterium]|nr:serine/threonine-protein kinase [Nannocystaceae bacterium]